MLKPMGVVRVERQDAPPDFSERGFTPRERIDSALLKLCIEVLKDNVVSQQFNELLIETGVNLESPEWDAANKILGKADEILLSVKGKSSLLN